MYRAVVINYAAGGPLGFSIRGGAEHGIGIFVSEVEPGSPAGKALCQQSGKFRYGVVVGL